MTNEGDDIAVYPEVSVILNIVKDPALGRRGALASVATAARSISAACDEGEVYLPKGVFHKETFARSFTLFRMTTDAKPRAKISLLNLC